MKAAVFHEKQDIRIETVPVPTIADNELLLRVGVVGVCGTDAHEWSSGPHMFPINHEHPVTGHAGPMIPGHEFVGHIVEIGSDVEGFSTGDLVVSGAGISCGTCGWCHRGRTNLCATYATIGLQRNGALADFVSVPAEICRDVGPYGLSPDVAVLAQPMSISIHAMRRGRLDAGDTAVIIGIGGIGAFLTYAASSTGATIIAVDLHPDRLALASRLGADHVVDPRTGASLSQVLTEQGVVPDVIYEVTGTEPGLRTALEHADRGTRIVAVGLQNSSWMLDTLDLSLREIELIGTNAHVVADDLSEALRLLSNRTEGWSDVAPIALPLEDLVGQALAPMSEGTADRIKSLIDPSISSARPTRPAAPA